MIACYHETLPPLPRNAAAVAVDVLRSMTTAVTAVAAGRRCFPVASLEEAVQRRELLDDPLLVGELGGMMPYGFDLTNSPADVAARTDVERPMVLLSTSGTRLLVELAEECEAAYLGCLRNHSALARHLATCDGPVALVAAGTRMEFRTEDQLCSAWLGAELVKAGFEPADDGTRSVLESWSAAPADAITASRSTEYLRETGQLRDLDYVLSHVDDLSEVFRVRGGEVISE